jgi:hypothetical protein
VLFASWSYEVVMGSLSGPVVYRGPPRHAAATLRFVTASLIGVNTPAVGGSLGAYPSTLSGQATHQEPAVATSAWSRSNNSLREPAPRRRRIRATWFSTVFAEM